MPLQCLFACWSCSTTTSCSTSRPFLLQVQLDLLLIVVTHITLPTLATVTFLSPFQCVHGQSVYHHDHEVINQLSLHQKKLNDVSYNNITTFQINANFSANYTDNVNKVLQYLLIYQYNETNMTTAVRVTAASPNATADFPVMFVVRQQEGILSWQVPMFIDYVYPYQFVSRTLCPVDKIHKQNMTVQQLIYIDVSTMAEKNITFHFTAQLLTDFEIQHGLPHNLTVTPSEPQYLMYTFPSDVDTVLLHVTSPDLSCAVVSVQSIRCPVFDLDRNVAFDGRHQTMTSQSAIFLQKSDFPDLAAFYVVIVLKPVNKDCHIIDSLVPAKGSSVQTYRSKNVTILIKETISATLYLKAIFAALVFFVGFYIVAAVIGCVYHGCGYHRNISELSDAEKDKLLCFSSEDGHQSENESLTECSLVSTASSEQSLLRNYGHARYGTSDSESQINVQSRELCSVDGGSCDDTNELDTSEIDFLPDADEEKEVVRTKTILFVSDLARKSHKKLSKTFKVYHWNLLTIAIFYGLPVAQLVLTYQQTLLRTGDEDLCYYNFDCAHPIRYFSAFNNVVSNMGYILLGFLFFILVWRRDLLHRKMLSENKHLERRYGIPQHFGLLYAIGLALVMEGIMSACYHVCPNYSNFQFDTSFMYMIACLSMLKIYETRHPDVQAKAYQSYFYMALVIFVAVLGVVYGTNIFWIFYALIHMLSTLVLSTQIYYVGRNKLDRYVFKRLFHLIRTEWFNCVRPVYMNRFLMLFVGNLINWACALYGAIQHPSDFASFLLAIFIGNLLLYLLFYIIMKLLNKEHINSLTVLCIGAAAISWAFALYFFFQHLASWHLSPAQSRAGNRPCILLDFYDAHDVWHFLSSISMFFSFLILLTLDDDLSLQRRDHIPVF